MRTQRGPHGTRRDGTVTSMGVDVRGEKVAAIRADPLHSGILTDFDGTLSPIVDDPATARPLDGIPDVLDAARPALQRVAVVSGRPVAFLAQFCRRRSSCPVSTG